MKTTRRVQRLWLTLKRSFQVRLLPFIADLKKEWAFQRILQSFKNYVPMYQRRTTAEHKAIRRMLADGAKNCAHLKGGGIRSRYGMKDYNVSQHTYPDGSKRIRCNGCGAKWFPGFDGWEEAVRMVQLSSNSPSASERAVEYHVRFSSGHEKVFGSKEEVKAELPKWNGNVGPYQETSI